MKGAPVPESLTSTFPHYDLGRFLTTVASNFVVKIHVLKWAALARLNMRTGRTSEVSCSLVGVLLKADDFPGFSFFHGASISGES